VPGNSSVLDTGVEYVQVYQDQLTEALDELYAQNPSAELRKVIGLHIVVSR
jgi:hypothetical protein